MLTKAQILRDADRVGQAVAVLEAADRDLPDTVEIKYELAMLYERQDRVADLERLLRQVIALDPDHAHAYNALGYTLADRNQRLPEALDLITQALELAPNDPFILDSMGWVKFRMGDQAAAAEYLPRLQHASRGRHRRPPGRSAVEPGQARPGGGAAARRQARPDQPRPARHDQAAGVAL